MKNEFEYIATVKDDGRLDVPKTVVERLGPAIHYVRIERKRSSIFVWAGASYSALSSPVAVDGRVRIKRVSAERIHLYPGDRARITVKDGAIRVLKTVRQK